MICKKCDKTGTVVLRKKDHYCEDCFITNMNHKFRSCIGKNKILVSNENVLVCLSDGTGSTVLLDLIHNGISMDNHKKLRVNVLFLHIIDAFDESALNRAHRIIEQCKKYNSVLHIAYISEYMEENSKVWEPNYIPTNNRILEEKFNNFMNGMPTTISNDLYPKIKRNLFIRYAKMLNCNFVFTAETTTTLATNLLANLALGRGSQVQDDVGFCDARDDNITIIRPMREISKEELDQYFKIKQLKIIDQDETVQNSLQSVIKSFVTDLQDSFPATISTVCKTADKIGTKNEIQTKDKCILCQSDVGTEKTTLTAFDATNFSRTVSNSKPMEEESLKQTLSMEGPINKSMFPHVYKHLCFTCSRNYLEMKCKLPHHVQNLID